MPRRKKLKPLHLDIKPETVSSISAVVLIMIGLLIMVSFTGQGKWLQAINAYLGYKLGFATLFLPFIFIASGLVLFRTKWRFSKPHVLLGTLLLTIATIGLFQTGQIGEDTFANLAALISPAGTYVLFTSVAVAGWLILTQLSFAELMDLFAKMNFKSQKESAEPADLFVAGDDKKSGGFSMPKLSLPFGALAGKSDEDETPEPETEPVLPALAPDKKLDKQLKKLPVGTSLDGTAVETPLNTPTIWEYPPLSLLSNKGGGQANRGDMRANAQIIENTLDSFGLKAKVVEVNKGPAITQYALDIARGTKLSKITGLSTDLALALAAPTGQVRIEAPIAGKNLVGVEVPNHSSQYVTLREMLASKSMKDAHSKLSVSLGIGVSGEHVVADIAKMPHLLIAGSTGSGKSVCVNAFLCSILFRASPDEVKLILVDPKRVELTGYNDIPHLLTPVINEPSKVVSALKWATNLMDKRYKQLQEVGVKNISDYNELAGLSAMPNIVIVIDELADIMLFAPSEVEESITRLAQMARAVGIHLVLATQRPSVDVITGLIKANIPTRIAFNVSSVTDSRVILDNPGAEKLLGRGDMLYLPPDRAKPLRVQGTYVTDAEIKNLISFLKSQGYRPQYEDEVTTKYKAVTVKGGMGGGGGEDGGDHDQLFTEAARLFSSYDKASSSLIQRRLSVGYARAARILDQLYEAGFVGPADGSKPREVNGTKIMEYLASQTRDE